MLAIVRIALSRPYTFVVGALLILLIGMFSALRMPVDIFPSIDIPIIAVAFQYQGLPPDQMAAACQRRPDPGSRRWLGGSGDATERETLESAGAGIAATIAIVMSARLTEIVAQDLPHNLAPVR